MKCQNCYAQIKRGSNICDYCGTQITIKGTTDKKGNETKHDSVSSSYELERLSPEFRQILGHNPSSQRFSEVNERNYQEQSFENFDKVSSKRDWGITQSIIEFFLYCIIYNLLEGYYEQQDVVAGIYILWSCIRAFNFFILKR